MTHTLSRLALAAALAGLGGAASGAVTLSGTVRDFCAPAITGSCTHLSPDFEVSLSGFVADMVMPTLSTAGLPVPGPKIVDGGSSAANFAHWFTDSPGVNLSAPFSMTLAEGPPGTFTFSDGSFFPIDGALFGNQGRGHNFHFTVHLEGLLSFSDPSADPDKVFTFTGDDDLWIFVDGKLVIDLGGVHSALTASFTEETLKSLGLVAGTAYDLDIFFAERHTVASTFAITTTLDIAPPPPPPDRVPAPAPLALLGVALLAAVATRCRR